MATHKDSKLTSFLLSSDKGVTDIVGDSCQQTDTHTHSCVLIGLDRWTNIHMKTHIQIVFVSVCVYMSSLLVLAMVHWIYMLALRHQCVRDPSTLELW